MKIQNLSVATKLWAIVLGLIGAMLAVGVWLTLHVTSVDDAAAAKIQSAQGRITDATRWRGLTELGVERAVLSVIVSDDALSKRLHADRVAASEAVNVLQKQVFAAAQSDADKAQLERIGAERKVLLDAIARTQEMRAAGDNAGAMRHTDQNLRPAAAAYLAAQDAFVKLQVAARDDAVREAREDRASALTLGAVLAAFVALLACLLAGIVVRSVLMPLRQAMQLTDRIAQGDLSVSVEESRKDELGHLLRSLSNMAEHLRGIVRDVRAGVAAVGAASTQIAAGNQNLASRTEQTAANLEETAASMEQLTATVTQSADTASEAYRLAASAADAAGRGGEVVGGVVNSMRQISEHSSRISDIIGVIDSIAFQTNILALNAAVEAARAGEQGRGFAVVAGEVRTLAQRSAEASKEIRQLIGASSERVAAGAAQVEEAGRSMSDIVAGVRRVADLIGEISAAAGEQRDGIGQVNLAVTHLDQMTQQNAALVEASNASAAALLEQARQLETSVAVFRTEVSDVRGLGAGQPAVPVHVVLPMHPQLAGS